MVEAPGPSAQRRLLRAGPLSAVLESGGLRWITWEGVEVLRGVYAVVRDRAWGTIEPELRDLHVEERRDGFEVTFRADHENGDVGFEWQGRIAGDRHGTLVFSLDGFARRTFRRSRIGFCLLHPTGAAGQRLRVETPTGTVDGTFPDRIAPQDPFTDIVAMDWDVTPGLEASIRFDGDVFEMEDQRNWTDASYKTFCTPLYLPYPVEIEAGTRLRQAVHLSVRGQAPRRHRASFAGVQVSTEALGPLPLIGFATPPEGGVLDDVAAVRLAAIRPDHLRVSLTHGLPLWADRLASAASAARRVGAALEIEATVGDDGAGAGDLVAAILAADVEVARLLVFPSGSFSTTEPVVDAVRRAVVLAGRSWSIGGGSRANFAEFNRATLPVATLDVAGYPINPQVHAFDQPSIVETLEAQTMTVRDARDICGPIPLAIGPVTLKPRFNSALRPGDLSEAPADAYPARVDVRQASLFAAAWTLGCIASLARPGVVALTFFETTGMAGLMLAPGDAVHPSFGDPAVGLFPLYHVFAALRMDGPAHILASEAPPSAAVLGLLSGDHLRVLVANLMERSQAVEIGLPAGAGRAQVRVLDETSIGEARTDHDALERTEAQALRQGRSLELRPWAIARIDAALSRPT